MKRLIYVVSQPVVLILFAVLLLSLAGAALLTGPGPAPPPAATATPTRTRTPTPAPSDTPAPSPTLPPSPTPEPLQAAAIQSASVYAGPDASCKELAIVNAGEPVTVSGRSATGQWLYVRTDRGVEGFAFGPRFDWSGSFESLAPVPSKPCAAPAPTVAATLTIVVSPDVEIEFYPDPAYPNGYCLPVPGYTLQIWGRGRPAPFDYYIDGELVASRQSGQEPFSFGYRFPATGQQRATVVGRVRASNGLFSREVELFLRKPDCP